MSRTGGRRSRISARGGGFDPEGSDLDFVVSFERRDPPDLFRRYFGLEEDLEALFGREVDLVMEGALEKSPRFARNVEGSRGAAVWGLRNGS